MRFEKLYIDGFGKFHAFSLNDLSPGLNVIVGPNEAGKSTILAFIKRVLFGFPDRRSNLNLYPPLLGGNHGGNIKLSNIDGTVVTVERFSSDSKNANVVFPDGTVQGQQTLSEFLGNANKAIYDNIYAFSLTELDDINTLNNEDVRNRLYSAGTGIGAKALSELQKTLAKGEEDLFKPGGSKPLINSLFREIKDNDAELKDIERDMANFDELHRNLAEITSNLENNEDERRVVNNQLNHLQNLSTAYSDWIELKTSKDRLDSLPIIESFPEDGLVWLEEKNKKKDELEQAISKLEKNLEDLESKKKIITIDDKILEARDKILEVYKELAKYESALSDLSEVDVDYKNDERELKDLLYEIGSDWDTKKLALFDSSIPVKEDIRKRSNEIVLIREKIEKQLSELGRIQQNINEIEQDLENRNDIDSNERELKEEKLKKQKEALQNLRVIYPRYLELNKEIEGLYEKKDLLSAIVTTQKTVVKKTNDLPLWPAIVLPITGGAILLASIVIGNWPLGAVTFVILTTISGVYYIIKRKEKKIETTEVFEENGENQEIPKVDIDGRISDMDIKLKKIEKRIMRHLKICGYKDIIDSQIIEEKYNIVQDQLMNMQLDKKGEEDRVKLQKKLCGFRSSKDQVEDDIKNSRKKEKKFTLQWNEWLSNIGLPENLSPETAIDIFSIIKNCQLKQKSIENLRDRKKKMTSYIEEYEEKAQNFLKKCNRKFYREKLPPEINRLHDDLDQAITCKSKFEQVEQDHKRIHQEKIENTDKIEKVNEEIDELLQEGLSSDETEFKTNAKIWHERNLLVQDIEQYEKSIKKLTGEGDSYQEFIEELKTISPEEVEVEIKEKKLAYENLNNIVDQLREEKGGIIKEIEQIERKELGSKLRMERSSYIEKLANVAEEWAIYTLANTILKKAIKKYEEDRQPDVFKEAQGFFSNITVSKYKKIFAPLGESKIYVVDNNDNRKEVEELSRGTAEQLYLSIRFGFIREFSKRAEPLTVIFDDIFVNFDPDRFKSACKAVKELAETNQILYFTCHPESVKVLEKSCKGMKKYILDSISNTSSTVDAS